MKHVGFLSGLYSRGVSIPPGAVVPLSDRAAEHFLREPGASDLTPTVVADAIMVEWGIMRQDPVSGLRFKVCPACGGVPKMTRCETCEGAKRVMVIE